MHDAVKPCENGEIRTDEIIGTPIEVGEINTATCFCVQYVTRQNMIHVECLMDFASFFVCSMLVDHC